MGQFYLNINFEETYEDLYLYTLNKECYECPYLLSYHGNGSIKNCMSKDPPNTVFSTDLKFRIATEHKEYFPQDQSSNVICDLDQSFGQFGIYNVNINESGCYVDVLVEPVNIYTPILTVILIYSALFSLIYGIFFLWRTRKTSEDSQAKKERIKSLDTFRGISIVVMIFANFGCGGYEFIDHAKWNGLHIADLVFPWFIWIMGACIPMSLTSSFKRKILNKELMANITKRSLKLFCLGIFLGSGSDLNFLRIFGVLQRFGVAYFTISTICIYCMDRAEIKEGNSYLADILKIWKGWIVVLSLLLVHTILIFTVAAPGCPKGYMGPGGLHKNRSHNHCVGGATGYIDELILGNHRYQNPTIWAIYEAKPFDPEGLLGCLTTIFHVFIGVQAGTTLIVYKNHSDRLIRWLSWAVFTGLIGGGLCGFSKEEGLIPVNKNLWSLSFVMVTSSLAFLMLSITYILVDMKKWWSGKPFLYAGMNAILMYIGHEMTDGHFPVRWYLHNYNSIQGDYRRTHFLALLSDVWGVSIWVLVAVYLYKINYFFSI
ncbi:unnamed protein product [Phaedon cochleariae]|uniref:Heparan-alpha-glucosaminide N-acetyltransferase n=1 Tax=Phaedon cochleariae TaxID=80249 RepID=A0A9P0DVL6_PHACE|nr:unnamed protein product [Phaedon cochleariae]